MLKYYRNPPDLSGSGKKANLILIFTALTALAIALPQMAFAQGAGKALDFDGVNNYVDCGSGSSLDFDASETYTWEGWFKPDTPTGYGGLIGKVRDGSGGYVVGFNSNNKLYVARHYGPMAFSSALTLNNWYHFAITYNNMAVQIYINGAIDGSGTSTFYDNTVSNLMLGLHDGAHKFNGIIDETRIWDVALSEAEIRDWMCKKVDDTHPQWSHLKGYWRLDESSGASCTDHSGNSNTGTMVNMDPATDRVWSAAAIGDDAAYTTTGSSINLASSGGDDITLQNIGGSPDMVALIRSDESPNYTGVSGLDYVYTSRYWEVWMSGGTSPDYDLVYNYDGYSGLGDEDSLRLGYRADAAVTQWSNSWVNPNTTANTLALRNQTANQQYILGSHSVEYITQGAGKALDFDGTDDYVDCGNDESLDITTGGLTIEAWIKPNQQSVDNDGKIFSKVMLGWSRYSIGTRFSDAEPYPYFALFKVMEAEYYVKANSILTAGQWTHVVGAWDGANYMIYINGELDNKNPFSGPLEPYPGNLTIGSHATDTYFKGTIDEVRIWNVARTEAQIRANMCKKLAGTEDNLVGYWRFDEREGTSCTDHSSNSNTGTMTNMDPATDRVWSTAAFGDEGERKIGSTPNVPTSDNLDLYLDFTDGVGSGAILAAIENNEAPVDGTKPTDNISERYWDIQFLNTGGDDTYSATGKFYWSGLGGMGPEGSFKLLQRSAAGENWSEVSSYSIDEANDYIEATVTSFSQYAIGYELWQDAWHDADGNEFSNRKAIEISGHTSDLTNYQVKVDVTYSTGMQPDFDDLRFVDTDGTNYWELNYWIESFASSQSAIVWVKIPTLSANTTKTIYMYYGNSSAISASNGSNTFEFFDDFPGTDLDLNKWIIVQRSPVLNNALFLDDDDVIHTKTWTGNIARIRFKTVWPDETGKGVEGNTGLIAITSETWKGCFFTTYWSGGWFTRSMTHGGYEDEYTEITKYAGTHTLEILKNAGNEAKFYVDDSLVDTDIAYVPDIATPIMFMKHGSNDLEIKWVFASKYASPEPSASIGSEEPSIYSYYNFPRIKWVFLGLPVIPTEGNPNSVLADDFDNKVAGVDWRLSRWNVQHNTYIRFNETDADGQEHGDPPDFSPGKGYWIYQNVLNTTDIDVEGYEVSQGQDFSIPLDAPIGTNRGLNMTSNPFNFKIDWSNSKVSDGSETKSIEDAATAGWVSQYAYTWDSNNSQYVPLTPDDASNADTISAWRGFWTIQMDDNRSCELLVPPTKILGKKSAPLPQWLSDHLEKGANHLPAQSQESWFLKLSVRSESGDIRDTYNGLGVSQDALSEYDYHDAFEFTPNATEFVMLYFPHNDPENVENYWQDQPYRYTYDIRNTDWEQAEWLFKVYQYEAPGDYRLNWSGMRLIPQTVRLSLRDAETGDEIADLRQSRGINFNLSDGEQSRSFEVRTELIEDNISPEFTIGITQNPILTDDIDIYVLPSEKLTNIVADVNGVELEMIEIDPMNIVYRCNYELEGSGNFTVNVSGRDLSDNDGEDSVTFSAQLMKSVSGGTIQSPDAVLRLKVPARAIENDKYFTVFSEAGEAEWSGLNGIGRCYRINPKSNFLKESKISFSYNENEININNESNLSIYIRDGLEWVRISSEVDRVENRVTGMINRSGVYRLFHTPTEEIIKAIPDRYSLKQNYPNPFNATTIIRYQLPEETKVIIKMYNVLGQEVKVLVSELQSSGCYSVQWDGTNRFGLVVPSGVYFYCLESKGFRATKKLLLVK